MIFSQDNLGINFSDTPLHIDWHRWTGVETAPQSPRRVDWPAGVISQEQVLSPDFHYWISQLRLPLLINRKYWEYFVLLHQSFLAGLFERSSSHVIGFGVGNEPIPAYFASQEVRVTATDYIEGPSADAWSATNQLLKIDNLVRPEICSVEMFNTFTTVESVDMNSIPSRFDNMFDLCYSLCSLGHIGGFSNSRKFILESLNVLKPGGIAIHTFEMDLGTSERYEQPNHTIFLKEDVISVIKEVKSLGFEVRKYVLEQGGGYLENYLDQYPFGSSPHLFLDLNGRRCLPTVLVIKKRPRWKIYPRKITIWSK
jgi:SAM-dependent methyltransferase